jgi:hypothetical protein
MISVFLLKRYICIYIHIYIHIYVYALSKMLEEIDVVEKGNKGILDDFSFPIKKVYLYIYTYLYTYIRICSA